MKKLIVYCCCGDCKTMLWECTWEHEVEGHTIIEGMGDSCDKCKQSFMSKPHRRDTTFQDAMRNVTPIRKRGRGR